MDNATAVAVFTLSGLNSTRDYRVPLFAATLFFYCVIWLLNLTIIAAVAADKSLHEPMYVFLCNLCANGLYGTAGFYPKFLKDLLSTSHVISYAGCLLQGFVLHSSACADFSLLALMSYDRYLAICRPLAYRSFMSRQRVSALVCLAWVIPVYLLLMSTATTAATRLCGSHIPKIYCVNWLISKAACSASVANTVIPAFNYTFYFSHVVFIVWSYLYMIKTSLGSKENWNKFMQTCVPHIFTLVVVVSSLLFDLLYMRFGTKDLSDGLQNFMAMEFLLVPPVVNPLIYGLKLTKIRARIQGVLCGGRSKTRW